MMKYRFKLAKCSLVALTLILLEGYTHSATAQEEALVSRPSGFALGVGVGVATMYGDLNNHIPTVGARIGLAKHVTNSLMIGIEYYGGTLKSEESPNGWTTGLKSASTFYSFDLNAKVSLGVLFSNTETPFSRAMSSFYIGSGIGYVNTRITSITETLNTKKPLDTSLHKAIKKQDAQPYLPLNIGYRHQLANFLGTHKTQIMVNLNTSFTYSDYIDGYNLSNISTANKSNRFNDVYSVFTVGLSFSLSPDKQKERAIHEPRKQKEDKPVDPVKPVKKKKERVVVPEFKQNIID